jgi:hypothetical protein
MPQPWRFPARQPTISLQRTRFAPRDRGYFRNGFRADYLPDLDGAPLNSIVGSLLCLHHTHPHCGILPHEDRSLVPALPLHFHRKEPVHDN